MSRKSSISSDLEKAFDKYSKFGKTQTQLSVRIGSSGIQKMMKDCLLIDGQYTSQLLDNDIARVLGKLTINSNDKNYPKGAKTFEINGFKALIDRIAESKGIGQDDILSKLNTNERPSLNHVTETTNKQITNRMANTIYHIGKYKQIRMDENQSKGLLVTTKKN